MFMRAIRYFIDTFLLVYDKIVPNDAQKDENGKIRRNKLRIGLAIVVLFFIFGRYTYKPVYTVFVSGCQWVLFILIMLSLIRRWWQFRQYKKMILKNAKLREERARNELQKKLDAIQAEEQTPTGTKKKKKPKQTASPPSSQPAQSSQDTKEDATPEYYYGDDEEDETIYTGISAPAPSAADSSDSKKSGGAKENSPWDDFAIGDALYGLPFNPKKRK